MYIIDGSSSNLKSHIRKEVTFPGLIKKGRRGTDVKRIQEWLCLHGLSLVIDGDYGPVTKSVVTQFQETKGLTMSGEVNGKTFNALIDGMHKVIANQLAQQPASLALNQALTTYAKAHLEQHPLEVGGDNCGPWVRLYMEGLDGAPQKWCAGFVTFLLKQACESLELSMPVRGTFSCDILAMQARDKNLLVKDKDVTPGQIPTGSIFLIRSRRFDWIHTGVVIESHQHSYKTIEGNTNDNGSANGFEVCSRTRGYKKTDFIVFQ